MDEALKLGWPLERREAYVANRRVKYKFEVIVTSALDEQGKYASGEYPRPDLFARHNPNVVFVYTPMREKSLSVWQFIRDDDAEAFMLWWRRDCESRGVQPVMRLDRHGDQK